MPASFCLIRPNSAIALPNWRRSFGVLHRVVQRQAHARHVARAELDAAEVQHVERDLVPLADRAEHVLDRHLDVVEHQRGRRRAVEPELDLVAAADHAHAALDEERGELVAADLGEDGEQIGEAAVGDPHLLAGQLVVTAVGGERRGGARRERVRARLRLGERVGADQLAAGEPRQVARLLLLGAEVDERQRADRRVRAERPAERRVDRDLLADIRRADQVEARGRRTRAESRGAAGRARSPSSAARASAPSRGDTAARPPAALPCA